MTTTYTPQLHQSCLNWTHWLTDPNRSLQHKASLARFIRETAPQISHQVETLIKIKLSLEQAQSKIKYIKII